MRNNNGTSTSGNSESTETAEHQRVGKFRARMEGFFAKRNLNGALFFGLIPLSTEFGQRVGKLISLPQLKKLAVGRIPWTPLKKPLADCKVALISTSGVHLRSDRPINVNGDPSFRVIPKNAQAGDIAISHLAYNKTDALRDINLVFPIERLRELAAERVIGRVAEEHYGFGLAPNAEELVVTAKEVARRLHESRVDLALLVPA